MHLKVNYLRNTKWYLNFCRSSSFELLIKTCKILFQSKTNSMAYQFFNAIFEFLRKSVLFIFEKSDNDFFLNTQNMLNLGWGAFPLNVSFLGVKSASLERKAMWELHVDFAHGVFPCENAVHVLLAGQGNFPAASVSAYCTVTITILIAIKCTFIPWELHERVTIFVIS